MYGNYQSHGRNGESEFSDRYTREVNRYQFDKVYKGFYDARPVTIIDFEKPLVRDAHSVSEILTDEILQIPKKLEVLTTDLQTLEAIRSHAGEVKTFEFDGKRYGRQDINTITEQLKAEHTMLDGQLRYAESRVIALVFDEARQQGKVEEMKSLYSAWATSEQEAKENTERYINMMNIIRPAYQGQLTIEQAYDIDNKIIVNIILIIDRAFF